MPSGSHADERQVPHGKHRVQHVRISANHFANWSRGGGGSAPGGEEVRQSLGFGCAFSLETRRLADKFVYHVIAPVGRCAQRKEHWATVTSLPPCHASGHPLSTSTQNLALSTHNPRAPTQESHLLTAHQDYGGAQGGERHKRGGAGEASQGERGFREFRLPQTLNPTPQSLNPETRTLHPARFCEILSP